MLMIYHGFWYFWYAYDQVFSRMPCGTYHFLGILAVDPGATYWRFRDALTLLIAPIACSMLLMFPSTMFLLASEIKNSIYESSTYQMFYIPIHHATSVEMAPTPSNQPQKLSFSARVLLRVKRYFQFIPKLYCRIRKECGLSADSGSSIRLLTPIDIDHRRCVLMPWSCEQLDPLIDSQELPHPLCSARASIMRHLHYRNRNNSKLEPDRLDLQPHGTRPIHGSVPWIVRHDINMLAAGTTRRCKHIREPVIDFGHPLTGSQRRRQDIRRRQRTEHGEERIEL